MKTVENSISKKQYRKIANGNCYQSAAQYALDNDGWELCHGYPILRGDSEYAGMRFGHAWVEKDGIARDTEADVELPVIVYYALGNIDAENVTHYTPEEIKKNMLEKRVWGPWK